MPTFGHRSSTGTYLDNLGYYYVINNYSDYTFLFDIQDKTDTYLNYEKIFFDTWFVQNYRLLLVGLPYFELGML